MLFEDPMPTLSATLATDANQNREYGQALTGNAVSNALYVKPRVRYALVDGLDATGAILLARVAKVPDSFGGRTSYGMEFQAGVEYDPVEHVDLAATYGLFLPGTYYRDLDDDVYTDFSAPAHGVQLSTRIHF